MTTPDEIAARNRLRAEAQLALLDEAAELARRHGREWRDWLAAPAQREAYLARLMALPPRVRFFGLWGRHARVIAELRATYLERGER